MLSPTRLASPSSTTCLGVVISKSPTPMGIACGSAPPMFAPDDQGLVVPLADPAPAPAA